MDYLLFHLPRPQKQACHLDTSIYICMDNFQQSDSNTEHTIKSKLTVVSNGVRYPLLTVITKPPQLLLHQLLLS